MKKAKKIRKIVHKNLDNIYKSSKEICERFGEPAIGKKAFKTIIEHSKPSTKTGNEKVDRFNKAFCGTLDSLVIMCETRSRTAGASRISLEDIKEGIEVIKKNIEL